MAEFWSLHTHSKYSVGDALPEVASITARAVELGYPALGLTDHGNMAGSAQLYKSCRKAGIEPLPGIEAYVSMDRNELGPTGRARTFHMILAATTGEGYRNLVGLSNHAHRNFRYAPIIDLADISAWADDGMLEGIAATTSCWFGIGSTLIREFSPNASKNVLTALAGCFPGRFYVEQQIHGICSAEQDDQAHALLMESLSRHLGIPQIIGADSHYVDAADRAAHDTLKNLVSWSDEPDEAIFPGEHAYCMLSTADVRYRFPERIYEAGMESLADLAETTGVRIPELDTFKIQVPDVTFGKDQDDELYERCRAALAARSLASAAYSKRMAEELAVVRTSGFAGYMLFTASVCEWMASKGITYSARGSASGSILCWLLGITELDPIAWGLPFERFLSTDRSKAPDIDLDVPSDEREIVLEHLKVNYSAVQISTWAKGGIRAEDEEGEGALVRKYLSKARKRGVVPERIPDEDYAAMRALAAHEPLISYGVHAAGLVVAPDERAMGALPMQWVASSGTMVSSFDKNDVEALGLLKLDILGVSTLAGVRDAAAMCGVPPDRVPAKDPATFKLIASGRTEGIFQMEGHTTGKLAGRMKPTRMSDLVALVALGRPATLQSGATEDYLARRSKKQAIPERHPIIAANTKDTYGILLYQEQALQVFKDLGMTIEEIEKARSAIKASNAATAGAAEAISSLMERVQHLAGKQGMSSADMVWLEDTLRAFAGYSFNKAHASSYAIWAYKTAWYRANHPVVFWTAMLNVYDKAESQQKYMAAARADGVKFRSPHVNRSDDGFTPDIAAKAISRGLSSIKGVGHAAAASIASNAPFSSLDDLARRVSPSAVTGTRNLGKGHSPEACGGVIAALAAAGALTGIERE